MLIFTPITLFMTVSNSTSDIQNDLSLALDNIIMLSLWLFSSIINFKWLDKILHNFPTAVFVVLGCMYPSLPSLSSSLDVDVVFCPLAEYSWSKSAHWASGNGEAVIIVVHSFSMFLFWSCVPFVLYYCDVIIIPSMNHNPHC